LGGWARPGNNGAIWQSNCQKGFQFVERNRGGKKERKTKRKKNQLKK
jgi:hypothetical protein